MDTEHTNKKKIILNKSGALGFSDLILIDECLSPTPEIYGH